MADADAGWMSPLQILVFLVTAVCLFPRLLISALRAIRPPPPLKCGSLNGPPVTAPRVKLSDGRYLAYKEAGVAKDKAKYKIIVAHAFTRSRQDSFPASKEVIEELGIYILSFDRAGYGQSDPNPNRNERTDALDIQELADLLEVGSKFYLISNSIGGYSAWASLKYIPHRLAGVAMIVPVVNYWWPALDTEEAKEAYAAQPLGDRMAVGVAHHAPWLLHWYMSSTWLPKSSALDPINAPMCTSDRQIFDMLMKIADPEVGREALQQGVHESLWRDMMTMFGKWGFDPTEIEDPRVRVDIWQGDEDYLVPIKLQRNIAKKIPWIKLHEIKGRGHYLLAEAELPDHVLKTLLLS